MVDRGLAETFLNTSKTLQVLFKKLNIHHDKNDLAHLDNIIMMKRVHETYKVFIIKT